jgi:hypothetical protein
MPAALDAAKSSVVWDSTSTPATEFAFLPKQVFIRHYFVKNKLIAEEIPAFRPRLFVNMFWMEKEYDKKISSVSYIITILITVSNFLVLPRYGTVRETPHSPNRPAPKNKIPPTPRTGPPRRKSPRTLKKNFKKPLLLDFSLYCK